MREIMLSVVDPLRLTLAADARLSPTDYTNDQIWELTLYGGEPPAIALQTTYGLRATQMRLFPRFVEAHASITDPKEFPKPPTIRCFYPNYLEISYNPLDKLEVSGEYWTPQSNVIAGRTRITNTSSQNMQFHFEWVALLKPLQGDKRMAPQEIESVPVLVGMTADLSPVVFITGGAHGINSPYPALVHGLDLPPGRSRQFIWCQVALSTPEESFSLAREIAASNWDAELARIQLQNSGQIEIYTGNPDWDNAFALSQKSVFSLFIGKTTNFSHPSFVTTRNPDDGYSYRGDGSDYGSQWNGQTPIDSYYLSSLLLPSSPDLAAGLLYNFLNSHNEDGEIDWKPGPGGQLSNRLATPLLASIAWRIYQINEDKDFLQEIFPQLLDFLYTWFIPRHDRDKDGIPEWDHPIQAGFEDHPIFARWHPWAQGVDITTAESPSLCAFLYQECQVLIRIAKILNRTESVPVLEEHAENLRSAVEDSWNDQLNSYTYWDRDSHFPTDQVVLGEITGSGSIQINSDFTHPLRLVIRIKAGQETTRKPQIIIHGTSTSAHHRIEQIDADRILWFPGWGTASSQQTYKSLEQVDIQGLENDDSAVISSAGFSNQDITTLLPIWAKIPSTERVNSLVENTIMDSKRYWREYGLPACPDSDQYSENSVCQAVYIPWCVLIGEGLISYGYRKEAGELVTRIMEVITASLKRDGCFRQYYNSETGQGFGDTNGLWGLAPVGLFLETLGVQLKSPWKVKLSGNNPFPWPVTVKYRGMTILRSLNKTQVVFPDGQTISVDDPEPRLVSME
ncbi:hypothetical protein ACFLY4_01225 [Chloroflexota bacterium]